MGTGVLIGLAIFVALYLLAVLALIALGRKSEARALATFIPDCLILVKRLIQDPRVPRRRKALFGLLLAYLALPIDLVPDFVPVAGQLDDAIIVALVMRAFIRSGGEDLIREHWPGPEQSLAVVLSTPRRRRAGSSGAS